MATQTPFTSFVDGVEFLKANGKYKDGKFKLEKSQYREFMELAGAPKPIQEAYTKAEELLNHSVYELGFDYLRSELAEKKKSGASKEELGETRTEVIVLGDATNLRTTFLAQKDNRIPQTNEIVTKYGVCSFKRETRRIGITKEETAAIDKEFREIINGK